MPGIFIDVKISPEIANDADLAKKLEQSLLTFTG